MWDAVCDHLDALGILSEIDGPAISVYSNLYARWSECAVCVQERGGTEEVKRRGATVWRERPEAKMARQLAAELRQWAPMFGLTPASRARLGIRPPPLRPTPGGPPSTRPNGGDIKSRVFGSHS